MYLYMYTVHIMVYSFFFSKHVELHYETDQ